MALAKKVLGQLNPSAATLTSLYTVPSAKFATARLVAANRSATPTSIRVAIRLAGALISSEMYVAYDLPIGANEVIDLGVINLATTDIVSVYALLATVSFTLTGFEGDA